MPGKASFCFDRIYRINSRKPERHWRKNKNKENGRIGEFLSRMGYSEPIKILFPYFVGYFTTQED